MNNYEMNTSNYILTNVVDPWGDTRENINARVLLHEVYEHIDYVYISAQDTKTQEGVQSFHYYVKLKRDIEKTLVNENSSLTYLLDILNDHGWSFNRERGVKF